MNKQIVMLKLSSADMKGRGEGTPCSGGLIVNATKAAIMKSRYRIENGENAMAEGMVEGSMAGPCHAGERLK